MDKKWIINYVNLCNLNVSQWRLEHFVVNVQWASDIGHWYAKYSNMGPNYLILLSWTGVEKFDLFRLVRICFSVVSLFVRLFLVWISPVSHTVDRNQCHKFQCIILDAWPNPIFNPNFVAFQEKNELHFLVVLLLLLPMVNFDVHIQFEFGVYRREVTNAIS